MYKLAFFVPEEAAEQVKSAIFATGAGRIGNYDCCCFTSRGSGQFRPLAGARPYVGAVDVVHQLTELKIELVCSDEIVQAAVAALKASHPYEEPAYEVWKLADF